MRAGMQWGGGQQLIRRSHAGLCESTMCTAKPVLLQNSLVNLDKERGAPKGRRSAC